MLATGGGDPYALRLMGSTMQESWGRMEAEAPGLAAIGRERFRSHLMAWLATVRRDGSPRLHPVTPSITSDGRLVVFMEPTSPKGRDLRRDGRYAMHCHVPDIIGTAHGEFSITGRAVVERDPAARDIAIESYIASGFPVPLERYILFELLLTRALGTTGEYDPPIWLRWRVNSRARTTPAPFVSPEFLPSAPQTPLR